MNRDQTKLGNFLSHVFTSFIFNTFHPATCVLIQCSVQPLCVSLVPHLFVYHSALNLVRQLKGNVVPAQTHSINSKPSQSPVPYQHVRRLCKHKQRQHQIRQAPNVTDLGKGWCETLQNGWHPRCPGQQRPRNGQAPHARSCPAGPLVRAVRQASKSVWKHENGALQEYVWKLASNAHGRGYGQ